MIYVYIVLSTNRPIFINQRNLSDLKTIVDGAKLQKISREPTCDKGEKEVANGKKRQKTPLVLKSQILVN